MNRKNIELGVLTSVRFIGWLNFLSFAVAFIGMKGASSEQMLFVYTTFSICCIGTFVYYVLYRYIFTTISKDVAITYFKPYRLGVFTMVFGVLLVFILVYFNR